MHSKSILAEVGGRIGIMLDWVSKNIVYRNTNKAGTASSSLIRNHIIEVSDSGLVSLMGGKLTSYRKMGEETVDKILRNPKLRFDTKYESSQTQTFKLIGSYSKAEIEHGLKQSNTDLFTQYEDHLVFAYNLPRDVARHLVETYGTASIRVAGMYPAGSEEGKANSKRLHPDYPFVRGEIMYAVRHELCEKPNDVLCRRMPIAVLNKKAAEEVLGEVVEIMGKEKKWSNS